jgi:hypothetical protein
MLKQRMNHNKFIKYKSDKNWEIYRKQRNLVTKIKRDSIKTYFYESTAGGPKATSFYPTIKPFLSGMTITQSTIKASYILAVIGPICNNNI